MLFHGELSFPFHLVLKERHGDVVLQIPLHHCLLLLWSPYTYLRLNSFAVVIERRRGSPHKLAVYFQWPAVFIVDEDADGQTLHLFSLEHSSEALLQIRPYEVWLRVVHFYPLHSASLCVPCAYLQPEELLHSLLVNGMLPSR